MVQRTVVCEGMLVATCRYEDTRPEDTRFEKQSLVPHIYIVEDGKRETGMCAWMIPGRKDRCQKVEN